MNCTSTVNVNQVHILDFLAVGARVLRVAGRQWGPRTPASVSESVRVGLRIHHHDEKAWASEGGKGGAHVAQRFTATSVVTGLTGTVGRREHARRPCRLLRRVAVRIGAGETREGTGEGEGTRLCAREYGMGGDGRADRRYVAPPPPRTN